jgi:hypothetical protein
MAATEYRDLVLVADAVETGADGRAESFTVSVFDSPVGQTRGKERVWVPSGLHEQAEALGNQLLDFDVPRQVRLRRVLGDLLLPPGARRLYELSLARLREGQGLRLRLRLADELAALPWEFLWVPDLPEMPAGPQFFLALHPRVSIVRHEALPVPGDWFDAPGQRRIIVAAASPRPHERYPRLDHLGGERAALQEMLGPVAGIRADFLPFRPAAGGDPGAGATPEQLLQAVLDSTADVFHFMGHGQIDPSTGEAQLVLADQNNDAVPVAADRLAEVLGQRGIRLVVLDACHSAAGGGRLWGGVALALARAGVPAVVAMRHKVGDRLAAAFSTALYRTLLAGSRRSPSKWPSGSTSRPG